MDVVDGRVVTLEYTVRLANGELIDSTGDCGPLSILFGAGQLFPPLEARLAGMRAGETRELRIPAEEAWGERQPSLVRTMAREQLPPDLVLELGHEYVLKAPEGRALRFCVRGIGEGTVEADFNPPGAGQELHATVTVVAVRPPTAEEERRGRV